MYDAWVFNAPLMKEISIIGIFKDPRQLNNYSCCINEDTINFNFIDNEIKKRVTEKKLRYYRQMAGQILPNDQTAK